MILVNKRRRRRCRTVTIFFLFDLIDKVSQTILGFFANIRRTGSWWPIWRYFLQLFNKNTHVSKRIYNVEKKEIKFTSKLISFRLTLFVSGRGESGRLPSLILSAPEMESESEWDRSSELDDDEENDTLPRCRRFRFRLLSSRSWNIYKFKLTVINYVKNCSTYFIFAATTTAATTTIQGAQRTTTSLTVSSIVPVL
jgi:hypothetical protein